MKSVTVGFSVNDLKQAADWYRRLLGDVEEIEPVEGVREFAVAGSAWLQIFQSDRVTPGDAILRFECDDIEASLDRVRDLTSEVADIETVPEVIRYFEFRDPFGNQLSFYQLL